MLENVIFEAREERRSVATDSLPMGSTSFQSYQWIIVIMPKFITKPTVVEALQFKPDNVAECQAFCPCITEQHYHADDDNESGFYIAAEGESMLLLYNDWIVKYPPGSEYQYARMIDSVFQEFFSPHV